MRPSRRRHLDVITATIHPKRDTTQLVDPNRDDGPASCDARDDLRNRHGFAGNGHRTRLPDVEPVYGTVIQLARLVWRVQGLKFPITRGGELPPPGGAGVALKPTRYFDFTFPGPPAHKQHPRPQGRFLAEKKGFGRQIT